jgi:hypothetical protein
MRRTGLTAIGLAALFACADQANAQIIGFKLGTAYSTLDVEGDATSRNGITGFTGGGYFRLGLGERLGLQVEFLSAPKGADLRADDPADNVDLRIGYVEVPVLVHLPIGSSESFAPYLVAGPTMGFETSCRATAAGRTEVRNRAAVVTAGFVVPLRMRP